MCMYVRQYLYSFKCDIFRGLIFIEINRNRIYVIVLHDIHNNVACSRNGNDKTARQARKKCLTTTDQILLELHTHSRLFPLAAL